MKKHLLAASIWLMLTTFLVHSACKKEAPLAADPLPPATTTGENTFGCYIDGEPWVAYVAPEVLDPSLRKIDALYDERNTGPLDINSFVISAVFVDTVFEFQEFYFEPILKEGLINIPKLSHFSAGFNVDRWKGINYKIDTSFSYKFEITRLDTSANICSGRFSYTATSKNPSDTLKVTDGRFDVKYAPQ